MKIVFFILLTLWVVVKAAYGVNEQQLPRRERVEAAAAKRSADVLSALLD